MVGVLLSLHTKIAALHSLGTGRVRARRTNKKMIEIWKVVEHQRRFG